MESIEEFFQRYFQDRTNVLKTTRTIWEPHVGQFFASSYSPSDRQARVRDSEQERILSVEPCASGYRMITSGDLGGRWPIRYEAACDKDSWRITGIEWQ